MGQSFLLMTSPPATGKTRLVLSLYPAVLKKILFVSPLRALANELKEKLSAKENVYLLKTRKDFAKLDLVNKESFFIIVTAELIGDQILGWLESFPSEIVTIFDEFHLFYLWGDSFRPVLEEVCHGVANSGCSIIGLTATMPAELYQKWRADFSLGVDQLYLFDQGNLQLKSMPSTYHWINKFAGNLMMKRFILYKLLSHNEKSPGKTIIFCKYRREVFEWVNYCNYLGIGALGCVGGEVDQFSQNLKEKEFDFIFATSTLGHGVNLPEIAHVIISYLVSDISLWIQMVGRGGRNGGEYTLLTIDPFFLKLKDKLIGIILAFMFDCYIKLYLFVFEPDQPFLERENHAV